MSYVTEIQLNITLNEGIEKALDLAIEQIDKRRLEFNRVSENILKYCDEMGRL